MEGPAAPLRIVEVVDRVDLTEAATDFGRGKRSTAAVEWIDDAVLFRMLAVERLFRGIGLGLGDRGDFARSEPARLMREGEGVEPTGVSFESGRRLLGESGTRRGRVVVVTREVVECVLRATERIEAAEDFPTSLPTTDFARLRVERKLTVSESSVLDTGPFLTVSFPPLAVDDGVDGISNSSSCLRSSSAR